MIKTLLIAVSLSTLFASSMVAQETEPGKVPDAPSASPQPARSAAQQNAIVFHKKIFWSLVAVDAASAVADIQVSWHDEQIYPNAYEQNSWFLGRRPGLARYYATDAVIDGGGSFLSYKLLHSRRKLFRTAGWALLGELVGQHTYGWVHTASLHEKVLPAPPGI